MDVRHTNAVILAFNQAEKQAKAYTDASIAALPKGVLYKGAVNYFADLPTSGQEIGDCYTVRYAGTSGTTPDGGEYVWGEYEGTEQWIPIGLTRDQIQNLVDTSVQTETERAEAAEGALDGRLDAVESVIPEEASSANKLADKAYVDDSIDDETERAEAAEGALNDRVDALENDAVRYTVQSKTDAEKATARANIDAGANEPHPYDYDGKNLKEIFGDGDALRTALAAGNYSQIHNGDYYPINFTGNYRDYGDWFALAGTNYYSDAALKNVAGQLSIDTAVTYVDTSPAYYDVSVSGATYHVRMQDCQRYREKSINQPAKMEVNINPYWRYGDSGTLSGAVPHICFVARDGIGTFKMRSTNQQWADAVEQFETGDGVTSTFTPDDSALKCVRYVCVDGVLQTYNTAYTVDTATGKVTFKSANIPANGADIIISRTTHDNPWLGSAIFKTLNDANYGLMRLIDDAKFASHILSGNGMRYYGETRTVANSTSGAWFDRGEGFLVTEPEVWGEVVYGIRNYSFLPQLPIFANGGRKHISKGSTDGASRNSWWVASSHSTTRFCYVYYLGYANYNGARYALALAPGFIFT